MSSELQVNTITEATSGSGITFAKDIIPATPLSHRNLIINGAMQVYQRNASSSTSGGYVADRFKSEFSGPGVTTSRETLSSGSPYDEGFRHFLRKSNTSVSSATSVYVSFHQEIEAQNIANSGWNYKSASSYITLSFWARSSLAGTYYTQLRTVDGSEYIYYKAFTLSANTWTKVTCTIPGNSNLQFDNDNGLGLRFLIVSHYGTNYTGGGEASSETWYSRSGQTDAFLATNFAQNWANTSGATFDLTGVQLERGSVATPFEHRTFADELRRCQRYYFEMGDSDCMGEYADTTYAWFARTLPVPMRAAPALSYESNSALFDLWGVGTRNVSAVSISSNSVNGGYFLANATTNPSGGGTALRLVILRKKIYLDAELS